MIDTVTPRCQKCVEEKVPNPPMPSMGYPGKRATLCMKHGKDVEGMELRNKSGLCVECVSSGKKNPTHAHFGVEGGKPTHCSECAKKVGGLVSLVKQLKCKTKGCSGRRVYGEPGGKATYCTKCRDEKIEEGMTLVNKYNRRCEECKTKMASCGRPGGRLTHCRECGVPKGLVAPDSVLCRGCKKVTGTFCAPDKPNMKYCKACHDPTTMRDPLKKMCADCGKVQASSNYEGLPPKYCSKCRVPGMKNVINKNECATEGCTLVPSYGDPGERATHCCTHGVPLGKMPVSIMCDDPSHKNTGNVNGLFGFIGKMPCKCALHRENGMIYRPKLRCQVLGCKSFGTIQDAESRLTRYCDAHESEAPPGSYALLTSKCNSCGLIDVLDAEGLCPICDPNRLRHSKELRIRDVFDSHDDLSDYIYDRAFGGLTSLRERPDFLFVRDTHIVIVEVDEHQHGHGYTPECDRAREINIAQAAGLPTTFIRYNPDAYRVSNIPQDTDPRKREAALIAHLRAALAASPAERGAYLEVAYLFYDDNCQEYQTVLRMEA